MRAYIACVYPHIQMFTYSPSLTLALHIYPHYMRLVRICRIHRSNDFLDPQSEGDGDGEHDVSMDIDDDIDRLLDEEAEKEGEIESKSRNSSRSSSRYNWWCLLTSW